MRSDFNDQSAASEVIDKQQLRIARRLLAVTASAVIVGITFTISMAPQQELVDASSAEMQLPFSSDDGYRGPNSAINHAVAPESEIG